MAESFARIFYRNAINLALPVLVCPSASEKVEPGHVLEIDFESGVVRNLNTMQSITCQKPPDFLVEIVRDGGLIEHLKRKLTNGHGKPRP